MMLPTMIRCTCYELRRPGATVDYDNGGQYRPGEPTRIAFSGALLPMSAEDLRHAPQGTYTADTRKLYTEQALGVGSQVEVGDGIYTVTGVTAYGYINPLKRYIIERKGESA